jgi:hypothetical protein
MNCKPQEIQACCLLVVVDLNSNIQIATTIQSLSYTLLVHPPQASTTPSSEHVKERLLGVCDVDCWCRNLGGRWFEVDLNRFSQLVESH